MRPITEICMHVCIDAWGAAEVERRMKTHMIPSDRGRQISERAKDPGHCHVSDVRGATGCYYCWLGEFDKCKQFCQLVHTQPGMDGSSFIAATVDARKRSTDDGFDWAARRCTKATQQSRSIFDLDQTTRSRSTHRSRSVGRSTSPTIHSLHRPVQPITAYKHANGADFVHATEYTTIAIHPSSHCYDSRRKKFVSRDDVIWSGTLVKKGQSMGRDEGQSGTRNSSQLLRSASKYYDGSDFNNRSSVSQSRGLRQGSLAQPRAQVEEQLSAILSGRFEDAFALPLPGVFNGV